MEETTIYSAIYTVATATLDNKGEIYDDLPAEVMVAKNDEEAKETAERIRESLDVIKKSGPITPGFKKRVILKSVRDQTHERLIYLAGHSFDE